MFDGIPAARFGPYPYSGAVSEIQATEFVVETNDPDTFGRGILDNWSIQDLSEFETGDFDFDFRLSANDIDILTSDIRRGIDSAIRDVTGDGIVDISDRDVLISSIANTYKGDSNLDGEFNSTDLVAVFQSGSYEDDIDANSSWASGDWDGDGDFSSGDLVTAFQEGGYEAGPKIATHSVPEPTSNVLVTITALYFLFMYASRPNV